MREDATPGSTSRRGVLAVLGSALTAGCLNLQQDDAGTTTGTTSTTAAASTSATTADATEQTESTTSTTQQTKQAPFAERSAGNLRWTHQSRTSIASTPVEAGDLVFVGVEDESLRAVDVETREERWRKSVGTLTTPPLHADGTLYVPGDSLYALDPGSGEVQWTADESYDTPILHDGTLYVYWGVGRVYALDPTDGSVQWKYNVNETYGEGGINGTLYGTGALAVAGDAVYVRSNTESAHWVHELDAASGDEQSVRKLGDTEGMQCGVAGGVLLVQFELPSSADGLYATAAYDPDTGEERWRAQCGYSGFTVADSTVCVSHHEGGGLAAVDPSSGDVRWSKEWRSDARPTAADDTFYVTRDGAVHALDASTGDARWSGAQEAEVSTPVGVGSDSVYYGTESGHTYAIWRPA